MSTNLNSNLKQTRPFRVRLTDDYKQSLRFYAKEFGKPYGVFFSTSGKACVEPVNPTAQYDYIWRTDQDDVPRSFPEQCE